MLNWVNGIYGNSLRRAVNLTMPRNPMFYAPYSISWLLPLSAAVKFRRVVKPVNPPIPLTLNDERKKRVSLTIPSQKNTPAQHWGEEFEC